jgi:hypothetical protein
MDKVEAFRTSDLYYAAFLRVAGVPFIQTETEGRRVFFVFELVTGLKDLKAQYFNRTAKVPALTLVDEIRAMKQLTHEPG